MEPLTVLETCLYVSDLDAAEAFYSDVLGLEPYSKVAGRHVFFRVGSGMLLLFEPRSSGKGGELPGHGCEGPGHLCFRVAESEYAAWKERLTDAGVEIVAEQSWPRGGYSCYFHDPDGNVLELAPSSIWGL